MLSEEENIMLPDDSYNPILADMFPEYREEWEKEHGYNTEKAENTMDDDYENYAYMDFQEANFNEYFDWAKTYRYALY